MGVLIIFSIGVFIYIAYTMLEPSERLKQQLHFFGNFPKGTKVEHSPTTSSIIITFPRDENGIETWDLDRISKKAKMKLENKGVLILEQNKEIEEALNKFISDRRLSSLFFKLIKTAFLYLWYFVSAIIVLASTVHLLLILKNGNNEIAPEIPSYIVGTILFLISTVLVWFDVRLYLSYFKNKKKVRVKIA